MPVVLLLILKAVYALPAVLVVKGGTLCNPRC